MFRKVMLVFAVVTVLTAIGAARSHGQNLEGKEEGGLSRSFASELGQSSIEMNNESTLYTVWYRSSPGSRWYGIGPLNYYDACQAEWVLVQRGYQTEIHPYVSPR